MLCYSHDARTHLSAGATCVKSAAKHHLACVLGNINKTTRPNGIATELGNIDIADSVYLTKTKKGYVQPTARIEIKLRRAVDHTTWIHSIPKQISIH